MHGIYIRCPKCTWEPDGRSRWQCSVCKTKWNTFDTQAECPNCGAVYEDTSCPSCHQVSSHTDWYVSYTNPQQTSNPLIFWKKITECPLIRDDKAWVELSLIWLINKFEPTYFQSLTTLIPEELYSRYNFKNTEEDAEFLLREIGRIADIDVSEISLVFLSETSIEMPDEELSKIALESTGDEISKLNFEPIPNVFWIDINWLNDVDELVAAIAQKLLRRKILIEFKTGNVNGPLAALASVVSGFGIFMGNSYLKFGQWQGNTHHGWRIRKNGYLPEQAIAYAMAWLSHYRNEDISWKQHFNKTTLKYFEQSYDYIKEHRTSVNWPDASVNPM